MMVILQKKFHRLDFTANYECTEEDTLEALVGKIRAYWGWQT